MAAKLTRWGIAAASMCVLTLVAACQKMPSTPVKPTPPSAQMDAAQGADIGKIKRVIGWQPAISLDQGLTMLD